MNPAMPDIRILGALRLGTFTTVQLSHMLDMSPQHINSRLRRLEKRGDVEKFGKGTPSVQAPGIPPTLWRLGAIWRPACATAPSTTPQQCSPPSRL